MVVSEVLREAKSNNFNDSFDAKDHHEDIVKIIKKVLVPERRVMVLHAQRNSVESYTYCDEVFKHRRRRNFIHAPPPFFFLLLVDQLEV